MRIRLLNPSNTKLLSYEETKQILRVVAYEQPPSTPPLCGSDVILARLGCGHSINYILRVQRRAAWRLELLGLVRLSRRANGLCDWWGYSLHYI